MKFGLIGRAWFAFQAGKAIKTIIEERRAFHARRSNYHGYSWDQVQHILTLCCQAKPEMHSELMALSEDRRNAILGGILVIHPVRFREMFGFDRPPPG